MTLNMQSLYQTYIRLINLDLATVQENKTDEMNKFRTYGHTKEDHRRWEKDRFIRIYKIMKS